MGNSDILDTYEKLQQMGQNCICRSLFIALQEIVNVVCTVFYLHHTFASMISKSVKEKVQNPAILQVNADLMDELFSDSQIWATAMRPFKIRNSEKLELWKSKSLPSLHPARRTPKSTKMK